MNYKPPFSNFQRPSTSGLQNQIRIGRSNMNFNATTSSGRDQPIRRGRGRSRTINTGRTPTGNQIFNPYTELQSLLRHSRSALVILVYEKQKWLTVMLQLDSLDDGTIHQLLKIFGKCFSSRLHKRTQTQIAEIIVKCNFFGNHVSSFIASFSNSYSNPTLLNNRLNCLLTVLKLLPNFTSVELNSIIDECREQIKNANENGCKIDRMSMDTFKRIESQNQQHNNKGNRMQNDYKSIPILPTVGELKNENPLNTPGYYKGFSNYFCTHFHNLREDFIAPMKFPIQDFLGISRNRRNKERHDICLYQHVQIKKPIRGNEGKFTYELHFDIRPFRTVDWEHSHQLLYGSLLCLSADSFRTVTYAVVYSRTQVAKGILQIRCVDDEGQETDINNLKRQNTTYLMVESPAYFEVYYSVLNGLQNQFLTHQDYLISTKPEIKTPNYLKPNSMFDLSFLHKNTRDTRNSFGSGQVDVTDISTWPSINVLEVDDCQQQAIQKALSSSIAIIQAPPGTGKIYIGLKIVQALLDNDCKVKTPLTPILVVFKTDNALDRFLEGLSPITNTFKRIGGRSQKPELQNYRLKDAVVYLKQLSEFSQYFRETEVELYRLRDQIFEQEKYQYYKTSHILPENAFKGLPYADASLIKSLSENVKYKEGQRHFAMFSWLGLLLDDDLSGNEEQQCLNDVTVDGSDTDDTTETSTRKFQEFSNDAELINIEGEASFEEAYRKSDKSFENSQNVDKISDTDSLEYLELDLLNDPYYMYNVEEYRDVTTVNVTDPVIRKRVEYIRNNFKGIQEKCYMKQQLGMQELCKTDVSVQVTVQNVWELDLMDRWKLYRRWIQEKEYLFDETLEQLCKKYKEINKTIQELISQLEHDALENVKVIGITVNEAAKYQEILQEIGCKIIIVEDAAQIIESQITVLLSTRTESLILIGDHQQLKPKVTTEDILRKTNLNISLFERLINNNIPYVMMSKQYRMRPEISRIVFTDYLYPKKIQHSLVTNHLIVPGMKHNVFFINHLQEEQSFSISNVFVNTFEAKFVVGLCRYLIQQGHSSQKITILTPYFSQALEIQRIMPKKQYEGIRVTLIDQYQGEENDIVLLSFVRSNNDGEIGCLRNQNFVNVALSRAKQGLYAIGNFTLFAKTNQFWQFVIDSAENQQLIGKEIPLICPRHPQSQSMIRNVEDFEKYVPNGGCKLKCKKTLDCGHQCSKVCHDGKHEVCRELCRKTCKRGHPCNGLCNEACLACTILVTDNLPCGHKAEMVCCANSDLIKCQQIIKYKFSRCGHYEVIRCCERLQTKVCSKPCEKKCCRGHSCNQLCNDICSPCTITVTESLPCGHIQEIFCSANSALIKCQKIIKYKFPKCGHDQEIRCCERLWSNNCSMSCDYRLECGHKCYLKCHTNILDLHDDPVCKKPCEKNVTCSLGHTSKCRNLCKDSCNDCNEEVTQQLLCGHTVKVRCGQKYKGDCYETCNKLLPCNHRCKQQCFEKCLCTELREVMLPCGHITHISCQFKDAKPELVTGKHATYIFKIVGGFPFYRVLNQSNEIVCSKPCIYYMKCGHLCRNRCNEPCTTKCTLQRNSTTQLNCGHSFEISCELKVQHPDLINKQCLSPCKQILACQHECQGTCSTCFQGRVHIPCEAKCGRLQICGHACDTPCAESCPPCNKKCPNRCPHSRCPYICGQPCQRCIEPCEWICRHYHCTTLCGEKCNRPSCDEPCLKTLPCGHPCIGLCGEVCPKLCRICNHDELVEFILYGMEDELEARFVMLEDCGHCIEVTAMDHWMKMNANQIGMKSCPRCKTTIWRCQRYGNIIRQCLKDVQEVKMKIFGKIGNLRDTMLKLYQKLVVERFIKDKFPVEYDMLQRRLTQKATLHYHACNVIEMQILLLNSMAKLLVSVKSQQQKAYCSGHTNFLVKRLMMHEYRVSPQELKAIRRECQRIKLCNSLIAVDECYSVTTKSYKENQPKLEAIRIVLYSGKLVTEADEKEAKKMFKSLMSKVPGLDITDEERLMIVNAIDVGKQGFWFKCPNGHPYAIGECGGAMELSKCIDCGAPIGGINHALQAGNAHAGEMDGSQYPHYGELANLNNFDPREFLGN